jgi:hypothetical protein
MTRGSAVRVTNRTAPLSGRVRDEVTGSTKANAHEEPAGRGHGGGPRARRLRRRHRYPRWRPSRPGRGLRGVHPVRRSDRHPEDHRLHLDRLAGGPPAHRLLPALRAVHRSPGGVRGLEGVRGAVANPRTGRRAAGHRLHPAARPAAKAGAPGRGPAGPGDRRLERRPVLLGDIQVGRQRRRHALRGAARRQRQVVRLVLAAGVRRAWLHRPDHVGRDDRPLRPDRGRRRRAVVRRHQLRRRHGLAAHRLARGRDAAGERA